MSEREYFPPKIDNRAVCIVGNDNFTLAACISSYFFLPNTYFPVFIFPEVGAKSTDIQSFENDNYISKVIGSKAAVQINNAISRMHGCGYIILAGMNEMQKSYLNLPPYMKIIEIYSLEEIDSKLGVLNISFSGIFRCKPKDVLKAIVVAKRSRKKLIIDNEAEVIGINTQRTEKEAGIVVVEENGRVSSVVAANYAFSINAHLKVVKPLKSNEAHSVQNFIKDWRKDGTYSQLKKVIDKINSRVKQEDIKKYRFATFFTEGLPYTLSFGNAIPSTYVHLLLKPDLFICNNIIYERLSQFNSVVVFSPSWWPGEEETDWLLELFPKNGFYTKAIIGKNATAHNFNFYSSHYPFNILHICSHGGQVNGFSVIEEYFDRFGGKHVVEYDEVIGFAPVPNKDLIAVDRKIIFREFDGFKWMSEELRNQNIPKYVFEDMRKSIFNKSEPKIGSARRKKEMIPMSCAIKCSDSIHQGMFQSLASQSSPLIFNNTCWSWYEVSEFFISAGCRGYIGTLWDIDIHVATDAAKKFYNSLLDMTILEAFSEMNRFVQDTCDRNIYTFWGLHFSTIQLPINQQNSRYQVFRELIGSLFSWSQEADETNNDNMKQSLIEIVSFLYGEIENNFYFSDLKKLKEEIREDVVAKIFNSGGKTRDDMNEVNHVER